jgi:hypothetical protein
MRKGLKYSAICTGFAIVISLSGCSSGQNGSTGSEVNQSAPLTSFSQEITSPIHQFRVKAGDTYTLDIKVKNTGIQPWFGGNAQPMTVDVGYRWVDGKGNVLTAIEGNRAQLDRPVLRPGESDAIKLEVKAPPNAGSYALRVSMVQEGVAWFHDKGTKPLVLQVAVD